MSKKSSSPTDGLREIIRKLKFEVEEVRPQEIETWARGDERMAEAARLYRQLDGREGVDALMKRLSPHRECRLSAIRNILLELHEEFRSKQAEVAVV